MMQTLNILFGFSDDNFERAVKALLKEKGYEANISVRYSKGSVQKYIESNPDTDAVVILEAFQKTAGGRSKPERYTAEEVAQLTEGSDVNVILVLGENHKGTEYMSTLLVGGITSAFFQKKGAGARPVDIATLILQKRTRRAAKEYYGIANQKIELGFLDTDDFNKTYQKMKANENVLAGYIEVCGKMSPEQIADFTRRLPEEDKSYLAGFEEFHVVMQLLLKFNIDLKIKRPRKVVIGLNQPLMLDEHSGSVKLNETVVAEDKQEGIKEKEEAPVMGKEEDKKELGKPRNSLFSRKKKEEVAPPMEEEDISPKKEEDRSEETAGEPFDAKTVEEKAGSDELGEMSLSDLMSFAVWGEEDEEEGAGTETVPEESISEPKESDSESRISRIPAWLRGNNKGKPSVLEDAPRESEPTEDTSGSGSHTPSMNAEASVGSSVAEAFEPEPPKADFEKASGDDRLGAMVARMEKLAKEEVEESAAPVVFQSASSFDDYALDADLSDKGTSGFVKFMIGGVVIVALLVVLIYLSSGGDVAGYLSEIFGK